MKDYISKYRKLLIAAAAVLCAVGLLTGALLYRQEVRRQEEAENARLEQEWAELELAAAKELLSKALLGTWGRSLEEDRNSRLELIFADGTMEYNFRNVRYPEYDQTLFTYTWEVADGVSIELHYPEGGENRIQVTFIPASGDTPEQVTFSPAITSMDASETWERSAP